ncbi:hypothetical protein ACFW3D_33060 [Streptomyces sp. NPDC058864]
MEPAPRTRRLVTLRGREHDKGPGGSGNGGVVIHVGDDNATTINDGNVDSGVIAD